MANRDRGEVSIVVEGTTYTLRPTINAICDVEDLMGAPFASLAERASGGDVRAIRALLWAYLQHKHGDEIKTVHAAGQWIERAGGLASIETKMAEVAALNAPEASASRPLEAQPAAAGATSTLRRVGSG